MMLVRSSLTNPNLLHNVTQIIEMRWWLDILELLSSQVMIDWNPVSFNKVLLVNLDSSSKHKSHSVVSDSLWPASPWNSPGPNTGVNSLSLLQGIFPTQGSNPGLLHCRRILYQLSHQGSPRILEWVAYPFSSVSSGPRNWTESPALQADSLPTELRGKPSRGTRGETIKTWRLTQDP